MSQRYGETVRHNPTNGCELTVYTKDPSYPNNPNVSAELLTATGVDCTVPGSDKYRGHGGGHHQAISGIDVERVAAGLESFRSSHADVALTPSRRMERIAPELGAMLAAPEVDVDTMSVQDEMASAELDGVFAPEFEA